MTRSWFHANRTPARFVREWNEKLFQEAVQQGEVDITLSPFALSCRYNISERAIKRILKNVEVIK